MNVLDLFTGLGGFSLGLERAGMRTVASCEVDPFCRRVIAKHWPDVPCYDDIRSLTATRLAADGIAADLVCGGFPCQDISHASAGSRAGLDGLKSGLWFDMLRLIDEVRPQWVIVENSYRGRRKWLAEAIEGLGGLGYGATPLEIAAHDIGANHERQRCFVLADSGGRRHRLAAEAIRAGRQSPQLHPWWACEPTICRVDDGFSSGVDRLRKRALGNAVLPQITERIGRAIFAAEVAQCR